MNDLKHSVREYWEKNPNAAAIAGGHDPRTREFYEVVAAHRYLAEPCIPEMAEFNQWNQKRVLEVGCGMGTDLRQFAAGGARVVGMDLTWQGIQMAKTAFRLFGLSGDFVVADAEALPFRDDAFDLVYSNGVIHHTPDTVAAVHEMHRVLHTGGQARVMVYHRNSYFGRVIVGWILSPLLRTLLWLYPRGRLPSFFERYLPRGVQDMYKILADRGFSKDLLFSITTDPSGPGEANFNPLARAYSRSEARALFAGFESIQTYVRQLYYADFLPSRLHHWAEQRMGWFLFVRARK
jgi:ubiquinone/menaquinone biosynthesis C-methylase UbiE